MLEIFEKFVKKLAKLDNYYVLSREKDAVILATRIIFIEHQETVNLFSIFSKNIDKELATFFLVTFDKKSELAKDFIKRKLPLLYLDKKQISSNEESIKQILDDFINKEFKS